MNPSELKYQVENRGTESHFFTRRTMKFHGDTMRNYGVRAKPVDVETWSGEVVSCFELYRRRPVKAGVSDSAFFCVKTFRRVYPKR